MSLIEIFSGPQCSFCEQAKQLLRQQGLTFVDYDITNPEHREAFNKRLPRVRSIPQLFINGEHIGNLEDLTILIKNGRLEKMLSA